MAKQKTDPRLDGIPVTALVDAINAEHQRQNLRLIQATTMLSLVAGMIERGEFNQLQSKVSLILDAAKTS